MANNAKTEALKTALENGVLEVVIREGEALTQHHPNKVALGGAIDTPSRFLENRSEDFKMNKVNAIVYRGKRKITMSVNEQDAVGDYTIHGLIELSDDYTNLKINSGEGWTPEKLSHALKMKRSYFPSAGDHAQIVSTLRNLKAKINRIVDNDDDQRGNKTNKFIQTVESNMPEEFVIKIPLFKGGEKVEFPVQVTLEANNSHEITCFLESVDSAEKIDELTENLINEEVDKLGKFEILIIEA